MASNGSSAPRLLVGGDLSEGARIELDRGQANYLLGTLRLRAGEPVLVFNGRDGEWRARIEPSARKAGTLEVVEPIRAQTPRPDLLYLFAPLKQARLDYLVQKAVEMGAGAIRPVITRRTIASRVNPERLRANAVEAAEQCGILSLPAILPELSLAEALAALEPGRTLVFCDEEAPAGDALAALAREEKAGSGVVLLVGPEGGFDAGERDRILRHPGVVRLSLGPRILRADTAAVAALAVVQATLGDWRPDGAALRHPDGRPM